MYVGWMCVCVCMLGGCVCVCMVGGCVCVCMVCVCVYVRMVGGCVCVKGIKSSCAVSSDRVAPSTHWHMHCCGISGRTKG